MGDPKWKNMAYILSGLGVIVIGLIEAGIGLLAIIDPAGAKLSDDADPFGPSPSRLGSGFIVLVFALVTLLGFWIVSVADKRSN